MKVASSIFRAYDVRGVYGEDLTLEVAEAIGKGFATFLGGGGRRVAVGRDVRLSGEVLQEALMGGLTSAGCNVLDIGVVTSPVLYFTVINLRLDGGVMVTASHNPPEWNGFKLCREGAILCGEGTGMEEVRSIVLEGRFKEGVKGVLEHYGNALKDYFNHVLRLVNIEKPLKVALDPGNGASTLTAPYLFKEAGCSIVAINAEPNGRFPAHHPEPTEEALQQLKEVVVKEEADFGVGYDGDGDRAVFIDERGNILPGDVTLVLFAKYYLEKRGGGKVVYDVSCSTAVEEAIRASGGEPIVSRVGHAFMMNRVLSEKAVFGGEKSSHFYFAELYGIDDGVFASLKLAEILSRKGVRLSELASTVSRYPSTSKNYECADNVKFKVVERLARKYMELGKKLIALDGVKVLEPEGWFLVRASNTQPLIKVTVESKSVEKLKELKEKVEKDLLEEIRRGATP
ncbi:MAG: phosphomannomutase/phosphoglucomutase [Candidatus Nezhaarchaeales archaeon]